MSSVSIAGDTSGSILLAAPAIAGSSTVTLPTTGGTIRTTTTPGTILQIGYFETGQVGVGTNQMAYASSTPTITQGDQYMSLAFTPVSATSKLKIDVIFQGTNTVQYNAGFTVALFQNGVTNCLACCMNSIANNSISTMGFTHFMTSGTTSTITFSVRAGANGAGTTTMNGQSGSGFTTTLSSSLVVTEIAA